MNFIDYFKKDSLQNDSDKEFEHNEDLDTIENKLQIKVRMRTPEELKELYKKIKNIQYSVETGEIEYKDE
jgi:glucose-6-phosphate isomerase